VGATRHVPVDVRIVAATNRDLRAEVNVGRFRPDLYFRLAVLTVRLPALRERPADIPLIARQLLGRLMLDEETRRALTEAPFLARLQLSPWPGNVRELGTISSDARRCRRRSSRRPRTLHRSASMRWT